MKKSPFNSAIFTGKVFHGRFSPKQHSFEYGLYMLYLDLDEIDQLIKNIPFLGKRRFYPVRFKREDYLKPHPLNLKNAAKQLVEKELGFRPQGSVKLLTHLRLMGYNFNPVSFYYCLNKENKQPEAIIANITNTPWGQRHSYVLDCRNKPASERFFKFKQNKEFHVSPFMGMDQYYEMSFDNPGESLTVQMTSFEDNRQKFTAALNLQRQELSSKTLLQEMIKFPLMTMQVIIKIYWQALKLKLKGVPYVPHPNSTKKQILQEAV